MSYQIWVDSPRFIMSKWAWKKHGAENSPKFTVNGLSFLPREKKETENLLYLRNMFLTHNLYPTKKQPIICLPFLFIVDHNFILFFLFEMLLSFQMGPSGQKPHGPRPRPNPKISSAPTQWTQIHSRLNGIKLSTQSLYVFIDGSGQMMSIHCLP